MTAPTVKLPELPLGEEVWSDHEQTGRGDPRVIGRSYSAEDMREYATAAVLADRKKRMEVEMAEGPLADSPKNRLIRSAIAMVEAQDLCHWSDDHDRVTLAALREYLSVWGDRDAALASTSKADPA